MCKTKDGRHRIEATSRAPHRMRVEKRWMAGESAVCKIAKLAENVEPNGGALNRRRCGAARALDCVGQVCKTTKPQGLSRTSRMPPLTCKRRAIRIDGGKFDDRVGAEPKVCR